MVRMRAFLSCVLDNWLPSIMDRMISGPITKLSKISKVAQGIRSEGESESEQAVR